MTLPAELKYTKDHEWIRIDGDLAVVGITEFAQSELGEIVFCDLPAKGKSVKPGEALCVVESTKAASDVYAPISGKVAEANAALSDTPALINSDPYTNGWMVKLEDFDSAAVAGLMSAEQYQSLIAGK